MPLFIYLTGVLSKNVSCQRLKDVDTLLYTYIAFQIVHYLFFIVTGIPTSFHMFNIFYPCSQNWYILALFIWRLAAPYIRFYNSKIIIPALFIFSLAIGFVPQFERFLALHQTVYWFPVFVLGYLTVDIREIANKYKSKTIIAGLILCVLLIVIFLLAINNSDYYRAIKYAFTPTEGYVQDSWQYQFVLRVVGYVASMVISYLVLIVLYNTFKNTRYFVKWGRNSLSIYLWHLFPTTILSLFFNRLPFGLSFCLVLVSSFSICALLTTKIFAFINRYITNMHSMAEKLHIKIYK